jgi:SCP-2 sterol transfer family
MDYESVLARCHLHAVLPLLTELVEYDAQAKAIIAGWSGTFQFSCQGGPSEYLAFKDGKIEAYRGTTQWPTVALWFASPKDLNKMFTGQGIPMMVPWRGVTKVGMLKGFGELSKRLEYYLQTPEEQLGPENLKFVTTLKMYLAIKALKEIGENDPHVSEMTGFIPNGTAELRVKPDGPVVHVRIRNGLLMPDIGPAKKPDAVMEFSSVKVASELFNDRIDPMAAMVTGDLKVTGSFPIVDSLNAILDRIPAYLA